MLNSIFKFFSVEILYNGHFQTWGTLAILVLVAQLINIKLTWEFLVILYLVFYAIYAHDRYQGLKLDSSTNLVRSEHIRKFYKFSPYIIGVTLAAALFLLIVFSNFAAGVFITLIVILGCLYPLYFKWLTKKIFIFKNIYVALFFTSLVFLPPVYYSLTLTKTTYLLPLLILSIFIFLRGIMMQILLDLKDIEGDKREGLRTIGVLMGFKNALKIFAVFSVITVLFLFAFVYLEVFPQTFLFLGLLIPLDFYCLYLASHKHFSAFIIESGKFIAFPSLIFLGRLIL